MSRPRFCEQCGTPLNPDARFCGQCGHAVKDQPEPSARYVAATPPVQQPQGEVVLGVIPGAQRRKGLLGTQTFSIIVTPERLVLAELTKEMMNQAVEEAAADAKREGRGWLGQIGAQMGWMNRIVQRYQSMPVQTALGERPDNFFILNSQVRRVRVEEHEDEPRGQTTIRLVIEANSGKYGFQLAGGNVAEARKLLRQVLGAAVR